jgi:uncharacterized membrane protein (UPF0182 family)
MVSAAVLVALLLGGLVVGGGILVDALWFGHLGYLVVFRTMLAAKVVCFLVGGTVAFAVIAGAGLYAVRDLRSHPRVIVRWGNGETLPELIATIGDRIPWRLLTAGVAGLLSLLLGLAQAANWKTYLLWLWGGEYGKADPLFATDIGFYLFSLPAYRSLASAAVPVTLLAGLLAAAVSWLQGTVDLRAWRALPEKATRLLSVLLCVLFLVKAFGYWLGRYELLLAPGSAVYGAGYTATHVRLPLQWLLVSTALAAAGLALANLRALGWRLLVAGVVGLFAVSVFASVIPDVFQRLRVRPDELRLERPFIERNVALTRLAYGLDTITTRPFPAAGRLDVSAIESNRPTFSNVRLWNPGPLLDAYKQLQVIRLYYDFHDVDIDRYDLGGGRRQVMVAAREIVPSLLPANARTWVNQRLQFTHGFGVVMSPVTDFEGEGLPKLFIQDIPPRSNVGLRVGEPRIYFGERTHDYVIVKGAAEEFDYPKGDENVTTTYVGSGGMEIGSWPRRVLFAWALRDLNLLISANVRLDSRILFRRSVGERISRLAPFLLLDRDPYVVLSEGRLFWIQDAYTTADSFPYSEPIGRSGFNYVRNSVKVVIDAYNGTVDFYATDPAEPVLAAYARVFPGLFRPYGEMPEDLRRHVRYPEDLFLIQAEMYRTYHMTNPEVFYNKEDLWSFPSETVGETRSVLQPYYVIMRLPGEEREEFILMQPMTPSNRGNMVAWLAARCDAPHYGQLVEFQFAKERLIYGPQQVEARIDQDTLISQQLSLWNQMGSKVIRGNLLVIPVEDSVVYIEPLYLRSEQGQIPELKRVIVSYGDRVAMEPTLDAALAALLGGARAAPAPAAAARIEENAPALTVGQAREHYRAALEGLRAGDWTAFAREMEALGKALERSSAPAVPAAR